MSETFSTEPPRPAADESEDSATPVEALSSTDTSSDAGSGDDFDIDLGSDFTPAPSDDLDINLDFGGAEPEAAEDDFDIDLSASEPEDEEEDDESEDSDEVDPADEALAKFHEELHSKFGDWYVVHTYSGMENRVLQNLENRVSSLNMEDFIFEIVVPTEEVTEIRNGQRKQIKRTVLPGYVLVRMDLTDESWSTVRRR